MPADSVGLASPSTDAIESSEEYGEGRSEPSVARHRDVTAAGDELEVAARDELRGFLEQGWAVEPVVASGEDEGRRRDWRAARRQIEAVFGLDRSCHVGPVPGTVHQSAGEQPAGGRGGRLPAAGRYQASACGRRRAPVLATPDVFRNLSLQLAARCAQTAGGADQHQPANELAMISAELSSDAAARRRADQIDRPWKGVAKRIGVFARQLGHRHASRHVCAPVEYNEAPRPSQRQERLNDAPDHAVTSDPRERHQPREDDERRTAPDSRIRQRAVHAPLDVHDASVPTPLEGRRIDRARSGFPIGDLASGNARRKRLNAPPSVIIRRCQSSQSRACC